MARMLVRRYAVLLTRAILRHMSLWRNYESVIIPAGHCRTSANLQWSPSSLLVRASMFCQLHKLHDMDWGINKVIMNGKSRDSSVGIALGYGLDNRGSRYRFPAGAGNFSLHRRVQNGSGAHPASYPMRTRGFFPGVKAAGAWSWTLTSI
jgi:hypothetical protein